MAVTNTVTLVAEMTDGEKYKIAISPVPTARLSGVKAAVKAFKDNEDLKAMFCSTTGASCIGITAATVTVEEKKPFNLND